MGKTGKSSNGKQYVSQGKHSNVSKSTLRLMRADSDRKSPLALLNAYLAGKNPWLTFENPNKEETNKRFIKVRANDHYGPLKARKVYIMGGTAS